MDVILYKFPTETIILSEYQKDTDTCRDVWEAMKSKGYNNTTPVVGDTYQLGDASFAILAPNDTYSDANNNSIALLLTHRENSFLFTGDAEEAENDIVCNGENIQADVYKTGHHGSKSSNTMDLLERIKPSYAVVSCSEDNSYGHPHSKTLNSLRGMNVKLFRTDEQGSLIAKSDGINITWNAAPTETWQAGESIENSHQRQNLLLQTIHHHQYLKNL